MKKIIIAIAVVIIVILIGTGVFMFSNIQSNPASETNENVNIVEPAENSNSLDNASGKYSSTTDNLPSDENTGASQNQEGDESVEYRPVESIPSTESVFLNDKLKGMNTEDMQRRAHDMIFTLRNFDPATLSDASSWVSRFSSQVDIAKAGTEPNKNILYQEDSVKWAQAASSYPEYQNRTRSIDFINMYMEPVGTQNIPVASFKVVEESNADYPMAGSDHWKPVNVVSSTYLVYFTSDGGFIYSVKSVDKNIIEKNIYNHPFDESTMFEGESSYYGR